MLQGIRVCGIHRQQHAAHGDVLLLGHHHGVRVENRTLIDIQDGDVDGCCRAGAVGDVGHQRVLVFHFDQQGVKGRNLIVQRLKGRERGSACGSATKGRHFCTKASDRPRAIWTLRGGSRFCGLRSLMQYGVLFKKKSMKHTDTKLGMEVVPFFRLRNNLQQLHESQRPVSFVVRSL